MSDGGAELTRHDLGDERDAVLVVRRGAQVRAYRNLCPHHWLPLTYRSGEILSADGQRLRCSNHGAEFSVEDGHPFDATLPCGLEPVPAHVDARGPGGAAPSGIARPEALAAPVGWSVGVTNVA